MRVEASPAATLEFTAASVAPGGDGAFALTVPEDAPPSVAGRAGARSPGGSARGRASSRRFSDAAPHAGDRVPVLTDEERQALAMRLVGDCEARRFHVELARAELCAAAA